MARRAGWPLIAVAAVAAQPALAQLVTLPLPGTEAGIVVKPGAQSEPALSSPFGNFVAYTDQARVPSEVWWCRLEGLLCPARTRTNIRLYSENDIRRVLWIRHLTRNLGVNLAGVRVLFELEERLGTRILELLYEDGEALARATAAESTNIEAPEAQGVK